MMTALMVLSGGGNELGNVGHDDEVGGPLVSNRLQVIEPLRKRMMGVSFMFMSISIYVFYPCLSLFPPSPWLSTG